MILTGMQAVSTSSETDVIHDLQHGEKLCCRSGVLGSLVMRGREARGGMRFKIDRQGNARKVKDVNGEDETMQNKGSQIERIDG